MLFDAQAALQKLQSDPEPAATVATLRQGKADAPLQSGALPAQETGGKGGQERKEPGGDCRNVATVATQPGQNPETPYGVTSSGRARTWTGKVVSLEEWRSLTDWDRHGSTGKNWHGHSRKWE